MPATTTATTTTRATNRRALCTQRPQALQPELCASPTQGRPARETPDARLIKPSAS